MTGGASMKIKDYFSKCTGQADEHCMCIHQSHAKTPMFPSLKTVTIKRELSYLGKRAVCVYLT